jgi:hypothetical protein
MSSHFRDRDTEETQDWISRNNLRNQTKWNFKICKTLM